MLAIFLWKTVTLTSEKTLLTFSVSVAQVSWIKNDRLYPSALLPTKIHVYQVSQKNVPLGEVCPSPKGTFFLGHPVHLYNGGAWIDML